MKFTKPPLSFSKQAELLINRGLIADKSKLIKILQCENYYQLTGYLYPYKMRGREEFHPNTDLQKIEKIMMFDKDLRLLVFKVISVIEKWLRTNLVYHFTMHYNDPFAYTKFSSYNGASQSKFNDFMDIVKREMNHSKEKFVAHYKKKYYHENYLPSWIAAEVMSLGTLNRFYQLVDKNIKKHIVTVFNIKESDFHSWINSLRYVRNICAHHNRLWNKNLSIRPIIPRIPDFSVPSKIKGDRIFGVLSILSYCYGKIGYDRDWINELDNLFKQNKSVKIIKMGFPYNWKNYDVWKV